MGVPRPDEQDALPVSLGGDLATPRDREGLSVHGQSPFAQQEAGTEEEVADDTPESSPGGEELSPEREELSPERPALSPERPQLSPEESPGKFTPLVRRASERSSKRPSVDPLSSGGGGGSGSVGVSVTLLTLDADVELRPHSRQSFLPTPRMGIDRDGADMSDLRLIRDFQVRRKYGRRGVGHPRPVRREKSFVELGLSGTRYFGTNTNLDSGRTSKALEESGCLPSGPTSTSSPSVLTRTKTEEDRSSMDSALKDLQSPVPSFPPLSPHGNRTGGRSENSWYSSRHSGQSPSLLVNHFGFSTIRPDTFSGIQRHRRLKLAADGGNEDVLKELEQHAQRHVLACQNMGYTHRGSRAAESVLSLKHTVSPSAFHPSSIFTRHVPRDEPPPGTPGTPGEERRKRGPHPAPGGRLSMPRLVIQDRQDQAARRATLPTVSGNSLQVVLAHSSTK